MPSTLKDAFTRYEHPFDYVINIIKLIRSLKSDFNLNTKEVKSATVIVTNEYELAALMQSVEEVKNLCKIKTLFISYQDENHSDNNLCFEF